MKYTNDPDKKYKQLVFINRAIEKLEGIKKELLSHRILPPDQEGTEVYDFKVALQALARIDD